MGKLQGLSGCLYRLRDWRTCLAGLLFPVACGVCLKEKEKINQWDKEVSVMRKRLWDVFLTIFFADALLLTQKDSLFLTGILLCWQIWAFWRLFCTLPVYDKNEAFATLQEQRILASGSGLFLLLEVILFV